jgi:hypothetical protein
MQNPNREHHRSSGYSVSDKLNTLIDNCHKTRVKRDKKM